MIVYPICIFAFNLVIVVFLIIPMAFNKNIFSLILKKKRQNKIQLKKKTKKTGLINIFMAKRKSKEKSHQQSSNSENNDEMDSIDSIFYDQEDRSKKMEAQQKNSQRTQKKTKKQEAKLIIQVTLGTTLTMDGLIEKCEKLMNDEEQNTKKIRPSKNYSILEQENEKTKPREISDLISSQKSSSLVEELINFRKILKPDKQQEQIQLENTFSLLFSIKQSNYIIKTKESLFAAMEQKLMQNTQNLIIQNDKDKQKYFKSVVNNQLHILQQMIFKSTYQSYENINTNDILIKQRRSSVTLQQDDKKPILKVNYKLTLRSKRLNEKNKKLSKAKKDKSKKRQIHSGRKLNSLVSINKKLKKRDKKNQEASRRSARNA